MVDAAAGYRVARPLELRIQARNLLNEVVLREPGRANRSSRTGPIGVARASVKF